MQRFRFPLAVAVTSLALVLGLVAAGGLFVSSALAIGPFSGSGPGPWAAGAGAPWAADHTGWQNTLPPELAGLAGVPADERFAHFRGVRLQLTDKDNKPLVVDVTPGTATTVSPTSLTVAANDGSTRTFTLDDKTIVHARSSGSGAPSTISPNDKVVVATLNNGATATAVVTVTGAGFGPRGPFGHP